MTNTHPKTRGDLVAPASGHRPPPRPGLVRHAFNGLALLLFLAATVAPFSLRAGAHTAPPEFRTDGHQFRWLRPLSVPKSTQFLNEHGDVRTLRHFRGKVVLLNFWATWCAPCIKEMPSLDRLQAALGGDNFAVIAVSIDRANLMAVAPFYRRLGLKNLSIYLDPQQRTGYLDAKNPNGAPFALYALPITYLIDHRGRAVGYLPGAADWDSLAAKRFLRYFISQVGETDGGRRPPPGP
ncbi:MAG: TlpA disulfide reductase family protein [Alphaproteobacteria bacterium]|nr:TlpA disulfide reductase family protein [Alphaproteobacteria bacterium]